jgi:acetyl-CoA C-acetyltransferase
MWVPGRDQVSPRAGRICAQAVYDKAGIKNPWKEIQTAEIYVPFAWFEPMWLENLGFCDVGEGGRSSTAASRSSARTCRSTRRAACCAPTRSGARACFVSASGPPGDGPRGEHQVEGDEERARHAYGGGAQYFAMWVVGTEP